MNLMSYKETADYLKISLSTLYRWVSQGHIPVLRKSKGRPSRLFAQEVLDLWLLEGQPKDCSGMVDKYKCQIEDAHRPRQVVNGPSRDELLCHFRSRL